MDFDMNQFFDNWDTADSYAALAITLIGFLFGLLIGYLLRSPRVRRLKKELEESNADLVQARQELGTMKDQLDQKEADVQRVNYDLVEMTGRVDALEEEKAKLLRDIFLANQEVEKHQANTKSYLAKIDYLNQQISDFENTREVKVVATEPVEETGPEDASDLYVAPVSDATDAADLQTTNQRLERFEAKLAQLESENQALRQQVQALHPHETGVQARNTAVDSSSLVFEIDDIEEEPPLKVTSDKSVLHKKIAVAEIEKDDLTKIEGIGPFLQNKLNEIEVFSYKDIAEWDAARIAEVTEKISYFPGRIEKDNWVGQARELSHLKQTNPTALTTPLPSSEDLKVIEGIGPKIEQLLKDAGINTWHDLAETDLERLQSILNDAGERYRIHDPSTWSQQALLAANHKWDDLRQMQDELKGGRRV